jgi:hypothetical protein
LRRLLRARDQEAEALIQLVSYLLKGEDADAGSSKLDGEGDTVEAVAYLAY